MRRSRLAEYWSSLWDRSRTSNGEHQREFLPGCFLRSNRGARMARRPHRFVYVGAQVGVGSFVLRFAQHSLPGLTARSDWYYLLGHWIGFMLGRFGGSALTKSVPAPRVLSIVAAGSLVSIVVALSVSGPASAWALVLIGFFHSIMFPIILALSIKNLGPLTKRASSLKPRRVRDLAESFCSANPLTRSPL